MKRQHCSLKDGPIGSEPVNPDRIEEVLVEYAITKICSFYEIGPQVDTHIGFDLLCYADCL